MLLLTVICFVRKSIGENYATVLSPDIFELAPLFQYLANFGIYGDNLFYLIHVYNNYFPNFNIFIQRILEFYIRARITLIANF